MVAAVNPRRPGRPLDGPEDDWSEAVRREATVRSLAAAGINSRAVVRAAADALGLSTAQVYRLIARFRQHPVTLSLVVTKPGPKKGARLLSDEIEHRIEEAISSVFMKRERATLEKLRRDIRKDCNAAGLKPPSRKAIQARVSARSLRELVTAREGADVARQKFASIRPGLRPSSPLAVVQIDHTLVDIQLVDDLARAVVGRPWLTVPLEVFSRSVLGFYLSFDAPSAAGVALAIAQAVLPLGRTPTATWADGVAASGIRLPADVAAFMLDFLPFEERIVRRDGVRLFSVTYYDGTLASLLDSAERRCRVKYNPRDMSAVFVEVRGRGHLRVPCADLGRPPVTLWEQRAVTRALRAEGRRTVDEIAVAAAILEQRRVLADAHGSSKAARRALARLPPSPPEATQVEVESAPQGAVATAVEVDNGGRVPAMDEADAWRTEFLP